MNERLTVNMDEQLAASLDAQREQLARELGIPVSRSAFARMMLREAAEKAAGAKGARPA
jgi:metal-responsive CopG/Arc/MetJ family transcriptional regulator